MWLIEEGRQGLRENEFVRVIMSKNRFELYGDKEPKGYDIKMVWTNGFNRLVKGKVNNEELIAHIKRSR